MYTPQALSACQDSPLLTADTQTGSSGYTLHFPPPAQRLCSVCWRGLPPSLYCWSALLGHDEVRVEVLVQGLREAPARTRSFPAFPNHRDVWVTSPHSSRHSTGRGVQMDGYGQSRDRHPPSLYFRENRREGKLGPGGERAPSALSPNWPLSLEVKDGVKS